ncbi:hypothetical protein ACTXJ9_10965 [Brachybacterium tyrofermentans]|uniref:hypothetical protein n=1 Tax=Brachybacterium tyrofermentans TaxID=47848 RepID=UPI003FD5C0FB
MKTTELTDIDGDALTITQRLDGTWITCTKGAEEVTIGPIPTDAIRHAFEQPMGGDDMDGGVTAAAIEAEVVSPERARSLVQENEELRSRIGRVEEARDLYRHDVMTAERREQEFADRADRAEQERDQYRADVRNEERVAEGYAVRAKEHAATIKEQAALIDALRAQSAAVEITHEMVKRAQVAISEKSNGDFIPGDVRTYNILRAALTPPPSRPEGAEGLADDLSGWDEMDDYGNRRFTHEELDDLADHLAALGYRKTP